MISNGFSLGIYGQFFIGITNLENKIIESAAHIKRVGCCLPEKTAEQQKLFSRNHSMQLNYKQCNNY